MLPQYEMNFDGGVETISIPLSEYKDLLSDVERLRALESAGVKKWIGWKMSDYFLPENNDPNRVIEEYNKRFKCDGSVNDTTV